MAEFCSMNIPEHDFSFQTHLDVHDSIVILHKFWLQNISDVQFATLKKDNFVVADPIDGINKKGANACWSVNHSQGGHYVTHIVDTRLPRDEFTGERQGICYYGTLHNTIRIDGVEYLSCYHVPVSQVRQYAAHYTVRGDTRQGYKPPLKVWTAAVCGIPVLASPDYDVPKYLPGYRYMAQNETEAREVLAQMNTERGTSKWKEAAEQVRLTYSDETVIADVRRFLDSVA